MNLIEILNKYIELYGKVRSISMILPSLNNGQYIGEGEPINLNDTWLIYNALQEIFNNVGGLVIDYLIGDSPTNKDVERRIKTINLKMFEPSWGKLFEEWSERGDSISIINPETLKNYYSQKDVDTIKYLLESIDAYISLINTNINLSVEQVKGEYLGICQEPQDNTEGLRLPQALDVPEASKYFQRCINEGWLEITPNGAKWKEAGIRLAYVCNRIYKERGYERPQKELVEFFNDLNLKANLTTAEYEPKNTTAKRWRTDIDNKIFFD